MGPQSACLQRWRRQWRMLRPISTRASRRRKSFRPPASCPSGSTTVAVPAGGRPLREHYTTSRDQAAALAAYVVGGRDIVAAPAPGKKPPAESPKTPASAEEPKPPKHQAQKPPKPGEGTSANAKPQRPTDADAKPNEEASPGEVPSALNPIIRPERGPHERPAAATRNRRKEQQTPEAPQEPAAVAHAPAAVVVEPARPETPSQEAAPTPSAAAPTAPASGESGENAPVPRDNVPD